MNKGLTWFNLASLVIGFMFLYLPIALLVIYSFNESKLVTVWGIGCSVMSVRFRFTGSATVL